MEPRKSKSEITNGSRPGSQPASLASLGPSSSTFHAFSRLPSELQDHIWRLTLQPRVVIIEEKNEIWINVPKIPGFFWSRTRLPHALQVNRNSRRAVERLYPLCFGSAFKPPRIRFNFSLDTIYFDNHPHELDRIVWHFLDVLKPQETNQLERIAIPQHFGTRMAYEEAKSHWKILRKFLSNLPRLREFLAVLDIAPIVHPHFRHEFFASQPCVIELFENVPIELKQRTELYIPDDIQSTYFPSAEDFEGIKFVWGWLRPDPPGAG